jgi:glycosyltransferase involved in cell wall biosynthesis
MPVLRRSFRLAARVFGRLATEPPRIVRLAPRQEKPRGSVVLSYLTDCFGPNPAAHHHSNHWECCTMARAFTDAGFRVEAIDYNESRYRPPGDCAALIDIHSNLERLAPLVPATAKKILHATGANWLFQNNAEITRLVALRERRGASLPPRRQVPSSRGIEIADLATTIGNAFTIETFAFARKPMYRIPLSSTYTQEWPVDKKIDDCRTRFLWFGSHGLVHKGLDLVLEAFARAPELNLTICGPVSGEPDFTAEYRRELALPNVRVHDWIDTQSPLFRELLRTHASIVYPSCSEGTAGSVITCLHGGLIPIVTREAGVDVENFGFELREAGVTAIVEAARHLAGLPAAELSLRSRATWEFARRQHTREAFEKNYRLFVRDVLGFPLVA